MNSNLPNYNASLNDAANAIASDNHELLRDCLQVVGNQCIETHLMQAWASVSLRESEAAILQALEIDPNNGTAVAGLNWVQGVRALAADQLESKRLFEAEEEARQRAEEEARAKAEEEARQRAEEEARAKAEEEARQRAEEETRDKAEEEARQRAEEQARAKAEEEAAQQEAEQKAEALAEQAELERRAEFERHAELERRAELRRKTEIEQANQAEAERLANLGSPNVVSQVASDEAAPLNSVEVVPVDSVSGVEVECELRAGFANLAKEIQNEVRPSEASEPASTSTEAPVSENQVVLVVDDSPTIRKLVSLTLNGEGYEVIVAEDGVDALNVLAETVPDMILTDINMPKLNGYKLCSFVKKHDRTKAIPVVMLSGKDGVFDKMRGKMNGCDDYICKPFESADLISKVREILSGVSAS